MQNLRRRSKMWYNSHMIRLSITILIFICSACFVQGAPSVSAPSAGTRYATDAFPGFDDAEAVVTTPKKTPRWFSWINGPKKDNAADQLAWAEECAKDESWGSAARAYDALVREWPTSPEAPKAQEALAKLYFEQEEDYKAAFDEYKYLLDYYPSFCAYDACAERLYEIARFMQDEGKRIMFFRFANTTEVRHAFEAVVLRAPGAKYAPKALLTVASLREDEIDYEKAVKVYENLRNVYSTSDEAKETLLLEATARMKLLKAHGSNRFRCSDTVSFLKFALSAETDVDSKKTLQSYLMDATALLEKEAYEAAKFYDSRTRTRRSAINAYEKFLSTYPLSEYADIVRDRLNELRKEGE